MKPLPAAFLVIALLVLLWGGSQFVAEAGDGCGSVLSPKSQPLLGTDSDSFAVHVMLESECSADRSGKRTWGILLVLCAGAFAFVGLTALRGDATETLDE